MSLLKGDSFLISMFTAMRRIDAGVSGGSRFVDEEQRHSNLVRLHVTRAGGHTSRRDTEKGLRAFNACIGSRNGEESIRHA